MVTRGEAMMAALVGGLTLAAAFPPWSAPLLAPLGLGAFFLAVSRRGVPSGAVTGFVFGLAFFGPTLWWLSSSIAPLAWAALVLLQAAWLAALGAGCRGGASGTRPWTHPGPSRSPWWAWRGPAPWWLWPAPQWRELLRPSVHDVASWS